MTDMTTKKKPTKKREPREDFNQAAFRIVQQATKEKKATGPPRPKQ
jgi:hypothetical protein